MQCYMSHVRVCGHHMRTLLACRVRVFAPALVWYVADGSRLHGPCARVAYLLHAMRRADLGCTGCTRVAYLLHVSFCVHICALCCRRISAAQALQHQYFSNSAAEVAESAGVDAAESAGSG